MQRTLSTRLIATALLALGAVVASTGASAHTEYDGYHQHRAPRVVVQVQPVYVQHMPRPRYVQAGGWNGCGAPEWDPQARYMPGQVVWQDGSLYVATGVSAHVWNVNSPPVWTPSYWAQAVCQ
jgi:hypothetical protein